MGSDRKSEGGGRARDRDARPRGLRPPGRLPHGCRFADVGGGRGRAELERRWDQIGNLREEVEREIATLGLGDCVHLAGYRTDADSLMSVADVVALSSSDDGIRSEI